MTDRGWKLQRGVGSLVATAIHDGHAVRPELLDQFALGDEERRREEDPFTGLWTIAAPNRVIASRSRFEVDLNRPRDKAVYRTPDDAWGLKVWKGDLPDDVAARSLQVYDGFYRDITRLFGELVDRNGRFVVLDLHAYNHRRDGPDGPPADETTNPQINVGTGTQLDRVRWAPVIDGFIDALRAFDFPTGPLDVRENVKFRGGEMARWTHATFPGTACVLSVEVRKFFMDEWSGRPEPALVEAVGQAIRSTVPGVMDAMAEVR